MDFRGISNCPSTRLATPSTVVTPQLDNYDLFQGYRDSPFTMLYDDETLFLLVFNLACVKESELKITRMSESVGQDILQVEVAHSRREVEGIPPFARDCTYRYILPVELHDKTLIAFWTLDQYVILVESSNFTDERPEMSKIVQDMAVDTEVEEGAGTVIKPRKMDFVFKSSVDIDVLRRSVAMAEYGLFNAKRMIENGSFACPDIDRTSAEKEVEKVDKVVKTKVVETKVVETKAVETKVVFGGFLQQCIDTVVVQKLASAKYENPSTSKTDGGNDDG